MHDNYLDNIPYDLLNIIFYYIKPSQKYKLTKKYFLKYYHVRFNYINNNNNYLKHLNVRYLLLINNLNYIKYLIKNDTLMIFRYIVDNKYKNDKTFYIIKKPIVFENNKYKNFVDLCKYYSIKFKSNNITNYIKNFIEHYKVKTTNPVVLSQTKYKKKKNFKNKNNNWIA